jgi:7-carboxy-7-deazaguanine synthase
MTLDAVVAAVAQYDARYVTVTGGEPLAQKQALPLLESLCDAGYEVSLETSGALDIAAVDPRVVKVMDLKTPGSGEATKNRWQNLEHLAQRDQIKFVLCDRADYDWACSVIVQHALADCCELLFSPSFEQLEAQTLADWILTDRLPVRFQLQLHKLLWGETPGR